MRLIFILAAAISLVAGAAHAQLNLMDQQDQDQIKITLACGHPQKANCKLITRLQAEASSQGGVLTPVASRGTVESALGVCKGMVNGAIGQRDGFDQVARASSTETRGIPAEGCVNKYHTVGQPLYPYFGYLVVRADDPATSLSKLAANVKPGKFVALAAGELGSGGQTTMHNILDGNPELKQKVHVENQSEDDALPALARGDLSAYFVMDGPTSSVVKRIKESKNDKGEQLYKLINVDLSSVFYQTARDAKGSPLYYQEKISVPGYFTSDIRTIATDAVVILNSKFVQDQHTSPRILGEAIDKAQAAILADVEAPAGWQPHH